MNPQQINSNFLFSFIWVLILLSACKPDPDENPIPTNTERQNLVHDNAIREYFVYVPDAYDGTSEVPLMLNFHGFGGTAITHMKDADMRPQADANNFILVYPQGTLLDGFPHWNSGLDTPDNKSDADDFGFIEAVINEVSSKYSIDPKRIYACGFSNGAFFSYALACFHSDKIAAIGSVSGTMVEETFNNCFPVHPTAMINIHGTSDVTVPYEGGEGLTAIDQVLEYWIEFNHTNTTPVTSSYIDNVTTIEQIAYADGDNGVAVEHYKVIGGQHEWFDISYEGVNISQLIWDFVSNYDIDGLR